MVTLTQQAVEEYLNEAMPGAVAVTGMGAIGSLDEQGMKDFGYGKPLFVRFTQDGLPREAVISTMRGDEYGHQDWWDRARILMFQHDASSKMERHVPPLGLGYLDQDGAMHPVNRPREFFVINEKVGGHDYFIDLERIRGGDFRASDVEMARRFARWLARVHSKKKTDAPDLYVRRVRNLVGDCECCFGLIDGYPYPYAEYPPRRFQVLEKRLIDWRWKLRDYTHRLAEVHGDFHPWNVLVEYDGPLPTDFMVLDRSRGRWGDPADDVACMTLNYLLFGLVDSPRLAGPFLELYTAFWEEYLEHTGDTQMLEVIAPFYVFRALVVASPTWYPDHPDAVRRGLFTFMENVLQDAPFDFAAVNRYMEAT